MIEHLLTALDTFAKESKVDADARRKQSVLDIQEDLLKEKVRGKPKPTASTAGYRRLLETHNNLPRPQQSAPNLQDYRITRMCSTSTQHGSPKMVIPVVLAGCALPNVPGTTATSIIATSTEPSTATVAVVSGSTSPSWSQGTRSPRSGSSARRESSASASSSRASTASRKRKTRSSLSSPEQTDPELIAKDQSPICP